MGITEKYLQNYAPVLTAIPLKVAYLFEVTFKKKQIFEPSMLIKDSYPEV